MSNGKETNEKAQYQFLAKLGEFWASASSNQLPQRFKLALDEFVKQIPEPKHESWVKYCDSLASDGYCDQETADLLKTISNYGFPVSWIGKVVIPIMFIMKLFGTFVDIFGLDKQYDAQAIGTPHPAPVESLVKAMIIDPGRSSENRAQLKRHGFNEQQIDNIILSFYRTTDENTVRQMFLRGILDNDGMYERMRELGYTDTRIKEIVQTWQQLPGPGDLFTMVAHEAFEPDIYKKLGLADEFPTEQIKWLEQQGISEAWALKFWIAHWEQPSIQQGYEMLHRGVIGDDDLEILFKAVEIPAYWRDKLKAIAYAPYTRVDVRRMHDLGVIDDEGLIRAYMDLGYDAEKAGKLAEFTIKYNLDTEKQLTRSAILDSYHNDLISKTDAKGLLTAQGYSDDLAEYYIELEDFNIQTELQNTQIAVIEDRYLLSQITENQARGQLNALGLRGTKIDTLLESWKITEYKYAAIPSKSELDNFLVKGIINEGRYREMMKRHGFSTEVTGWYLADLQAELKGGARRLTKTDILNLYKKNIIDHDEYIRRMESLGYTAFDAELLIK